MTNETVKKEGFKLTKLGWIPEDWNIKKFKDLAIERRLGGNYENSNSSKGIPLIKMGNIGRGYIKLDVLQYVDGNVKINNDDLLIQGDLLFNTRNTLDLVGKVAIWRNELPSAVYNSNLMRIKFDPKSIDSNYFMNYAFNSHYALSKLRGVATGTTSVAAIYGRDLNVLRFILPPKSEQRTITACLSTWDNAIQTLTQLIEQKKLRKKWLMQVLLTGKKRLPGFDADWQETSLSEITKRISRRNTELNNNVVTISAQRGFVRQEDFFTKRVASDTLSHYHLLKRGEFAYNKSYSNGYPMGAFKRLDNFAKAVVTTLYICFDIKADINSDFVNQFFNAGLMNHGLMRIAQEGGRAHGLLNIGLSDFYGLKLILPKYEEQTAIAKVLQTADKEIEILARKLDFLKDQKKGLMQQLLTGKKRLKISNN